MISLVFSEKVNLRNRDHEGPYNDKFGVKLNPFIGRGQWVFICLIPIIQQVRQSCLITPLTLGIIPVEFERLSVGAYWSTWGICGSVKKWVKIFSIISCMWKASSGIVEHSVTHSILKNYLIAEMRYQHLSTTLWKRWEGMPPQTWICTVDLGLVRPP